MIDTFEAHTFSSGSNWRRRDIDPRHIHASALKAHQQLKVRAGFAAEFMHCVRARTFRKRTACSESTLEAGSAKQRLFH